MKKFIWSLLVLSVALSSVIPAHSTDLTSMLFNHALHKVSHGHKSHDRKTQAEPVNVDLPRATGNFGACQQYFANGTPPAVPDLAGKAPRALCFDGFAVMHSGKTKTPLYSAELLNRQSIQEAKGVKRTNIFFEDARLPSSERASLDDYRGSTFDRGHMSPAGDRVGAQSMAQSFSLANMIPQAPENNQKAWADIEDATRRYALRAQGNVYVVTGPVFDGRCPILRGSLYPTKKPYSYDLERCTIGVGAVSVPTYIYKLVYDATSNRAWAHWIENIDQASVQRPITYDELVRRTGIQFLPGIHPKS